MLPWGTPDNTGSGSDIELQILTHWKRLKVAVKPVPEISCNAVN